jgi:hypothetical protein
VYTARVRPFVLWNFCCIVQQRSRTPQPIVGHYAAANSDLRCIRVAVFPASGCQPPSISQERHTVPGRDPSKRLFRYFRWSACRRGGVNPAQPVDTFRVSTYLAEFPSQTGQILSTFFNYFSIFFHQGQNMHLLWCNPSAHCANESKSDSNTTIRQPMGKKWRKMLTPGV